MKNGSEQRLRRSAGKIFAILPLFAAASLLLCTCGRKTLPRPPELVAPQTITDLSAHDTADGIALEWKRPERYVDGSRMMDLGGFRIERKRGTEPFRTIADLAVQDRDRFRQIRHFHHLDKHAQVGADYEYRVVAYTLDGYVSDASNLASALRGGSGTPAPSAAAGNEAPPAP